MTNSETHQLVRGIDIVKLPMWHYISGLSVDCDGTSQSVAVPSSASIVEIRAEGGAVYFAINPPGFAIAGAPGYIPEDGAEIIGPLSNLTSLDVSGVTNTTAHIMFFNEIAR